MSLTIDKLSLLATLAPPRQKTDVNTVPQGSAFAEKFDKALDNGVAVTSTATGKAKELAQTLTLQMLESSLSLGGDYPVNAAVPVGTSKLPLIQAYLDAYRANLAAGAEIAPPPPQSASRFLRVSQTRSIPLIPSGGSSP